MLDLIQLELLIMKAELIVDGVCLHSKRKGCLDQERITYLNRSVGYLRAARSIVRSEIGTKQYTLNNTSNQKPWERLEIKRQWVCGICDIKGDLD